LIQYTNVIRSAPCVIKYSDINNQTINIKYSDLYESYATRTLIYIFNNANNDAKTNNQYNSRE